MRSIRPESLDSFPTRRREFSSVSIHDVRLYGAQLNLQYHCQLFSDGFKISFCGNMCIKYEWFTGWEWLKYRVLRLQLNLFLYWSSIFLWDRWIIDLESGSIHTGSGQWTLKSLRIVRFYLSEQVLCTSVSKQDKLLIDNLHWLRLWLPWFLLQTISANIVCVLLT